MQDLRVRAHIDAPVQRVFDAVSDHEVFLGSQEGVTSKVVRAGIAERNGLGCLREVRVGNRTHYAEEITAWERPAMFEYTIRETSLPLRHYGSRLTFTPHAGGTDVEWTSRFDVTTPLVGRLLGMYVKRRLAKYFSESLAAAKARLEASERFVRED